MVIMHFDLIKFERQYHWLQGIGTVRSINQNGEGSGAGLRLEHAMTVEVLPDGDAPAPGDSRRERIQDSGSPRPLAGVCNEGCCYRAIVDEVLTVADVVNLYTVDGKTQELPRRAVQSSVLPESWRAYFRKRLLEPAIGPPE